MTPPLTVSVFLDHDNSVKLGDFGLSKILQSHDFASTYVGTPFYMSPEICKAEQYGPHSDIWALGCIIYEMCAKQPPFNAKTHFELIQKIKSGRYPPIPSCYSPELNKVIASCLQVFPNNRPDTAQLLNLPVVKLMRKEQEVVKLGQALKEQKEKLAQREKELEAKYFQMRKELNEQLRREWEVKAQLEIERRVKIEVDRRTHIEFKSLQDKFEAEVNAQVEKALKKYPARLSTSPKLAPRSSTPVMPAEQGLLFPAEGDTTIINGSTSTLGTDSDIASGTDISSLSLNDPTEDVTTTTSKPVSKKRIRAPLARAQTMAAPAAHPPSPMDVQMADPSPAPASIQGLSLSPRRHQVRQNIFAAARDGVKKWDSEVPPSPTEEDWNGDLDDDDVPALPSPTRARSASGGRNGNEDPFKVLAATNKLLLKPTQRLANTPSLAPTSTKPRPASAVPVVATSPSRQRTKATETTSPVRKAVKSAENSGALKSKRGNEAIRLQAMRNNGGVQGRTLVELQQARGIVPQTLSEDEGKRGLMRTGLRSPVKARSAMNVSEAAVWDPDTEPEMPSPFIRRSKNQLVK